MEFRCIKDRVKLVLQLNPITRDSDYILLATIWQNESRMIGDSVINLLYREKLSSPDSIMRARRKIQEESPELRGEKYLKRHAHQEKIIKEIYNE